MTVSALLLVGTVYLYMVIPKGFIGSSDIDQISGSTEAIQGISFDVMRQHQLQVQQIIQADPYVDYVTGGVGGGGGINRGKLNIHLRPRKHTPSSGSGDAGVARKARCRSGHCRVSSK